MTKTQRIAIPFSASISRNRPRSFVWLTSSAVAVTLSAAAWAQQEPSANVVRTRVQARPGGPIEEIEMRVHESPSDLLSLRASAAELGDDELVLGVVQNGAAMAYPIRYLAMFEVANDRVGGVPIAPTW